MGSRGIALLYHDLGTRRARGQCHVPAVLYLQEKPGTHFTEGWLGRRPSLDRCGKSRLHGNSITGPSRTQPVAIPAALPDLRICGRADGILTQRLNVCSEKSPTATERVQRKESHRYWTCAAKRVPPLPGPRICGRAGGILTQRLIVCSEESPTASSTYAKPQKIVNNGFIQHQLMHSPMMDRGPGIVIGIATGYGLDGPGIESRWGRDFSHMSRPAPGPTQPPVQCVPGLPRG
jgi:hypothetical protein